MSRLPGGKTCIGASFIPPFDINHRMAQETEKAADFAPTACPTLLPLLDEPRTFCYEHQIEDIPSALALKAAQPSLARGLLLL